MFKKITEHLHFLNYIKFTYLIRFSNRQESESESESESQCVKRHDYVHCFSYPARGSRKCV
jgi:hypothetical protein